ncbi:hypothetical protein WOSG25_011850 [Weissella oryzae SG25]|uniref:Uncharacterized protein n=1 Tax=Weissella oryzae (strain DSM 25784 / JCM 18191 / LMG 30913 / SG25) TaxID=1329250 RepID=A0A069CS65_WEIOS|nr:PC4/YdbC family ssDNA-binding protein [Weissella oryzae]GAK30088.1 hypothetical protein WOSG25_011850 [Weissella oryzae SG25]
MADLKYEILEKFGVLSTSKSGWNLELNFVQWGEAKPKFDLRSWSADHSKMGKGLTLTHDDLVNLNKLTEQILAFEQGGQGQVNSGTNPPVETSQSPEVDDDNEFGVLRRL